MKNDINYTVLASRLKSRDLLWLHKVFSPKAQKIINILHLPFYFFTLPIRWIFKKRSKGEFKYHLSICAIIKDEGEYIEEWVKYYLAIGVNHFYIFDNGSTDNTKEVLQKYIDKGLVSFISFPGKVKQLDAYNTCLNRYALESKYIAFFDADEFLYVPEDKDIHKELDEFFKRNNAGALHVNWCIFGSSHKEKKEKGYVIERFLYRSDLHHPNNAVIKSIVDPRKTKAMVNPHYGQHPKKFPPYSLDNKVTEGYANREFECMDIRLNHYFCKSKEEFAIKTNKGFADQLNPRDLSRFNEQDMNDVFDDSMLVYVKRMK